LLSYRLSALPSIIRVREKRHPKFYLLAKRIVRTLKNHRGPLAMEERGSLFEGWVGNSLRASNDYSRIFDEWYYWSPAEAKTEVDFVLKQGKDIIAIEVKSSSRVRPEDTKGLKAISELESVKRRILVYTGDTARRDSDGVEILPVSDFLKELKNGF
jgi:predicted AAA+ superfamily ATPase